MHDVYFIPILSRAIRRPDPKPALREAFEQIERLSREPGNEQGYSQFLQWMALARDEIEATQVEDETIPESMKEFMDAALAEVLGAPAGFELRLVQADRIIAQVTLAPPTPRAWISGVTPDDYRFELETGWALWEGLLEAQDLIWADAHPDRPLELAAATNDEEARPTRLIEALPGELRIAIYAGPESGKIRIEAL